MTEEDCRRYNEEREPFLDGHVCEVLWTRTYRLGRLRVNLTWMRFESRSGRELSFHVWWGGP